MAPRKDAKKDAETTVTAESKAVMRREPQEIQAMPVSSMNDIIAVGDFFSRSGMFGCKSKEQGQVLALTCHMEKMTPLQFKRRFHMIDGNLSMRADAMLAEARCNYGASHKWIKRDADGAEIELTTAGGSVGRFSLTWEEAQQEPFVYATGSNPSTPKEKRKFKTNYATPRARMQTLAARVASDAVRAMVPEVNAGAYTPEEVEDFSGAAGGSAPVRVVEPSEIESKVIEAQAKEETEVVEPEVVEDVKVEEPEVVKPKAETPKKDKQSKKDDSDGIDYNVMPGNGKNSGKKWSEFEIPDLKIIVDTGLQHGLKQGHIDAARGVMKEMLGIE